MRPTGKLHIGHYFGALENWVRLQNDPTYDCFYFIADWHALTSDYADTSAVAQNTIEIVTDYLAAGLDPNRENCTIFQQSLIPEHAELHLLLGMVTPLGWLERVPTYKEQIENVTSKDLHTYGFLGYPCLQTADIVMYSEPGTPLFVPVGEDQVSHVELSREIVRKFNFHFGFKVKRELFIPANFADYCNALKQLRVVRTLRELVDSAQEPLEAGDAIKTSVLMKYATEVGMANFMDEMGKFRGYFEFKEVLTEPEHQLTQTPRIPGLDGRKMSKSYGNAIMLSETDEDIRKKTKVMVTDPARKRRTDPGNPDVCPVYDWHKLFAPRNEAGEYTSEGKATLDWSAHGCRTAGIGCIECKAAMAENLIKWIAPIRERRVEFEKNPARVLEIIDNGSNRARTVAQGTMQRVREAVFGWQKKRAEIQSVSVAVHDTHD
jgi:tryptophanyl-tRNA synthetase